MIAVPSDDPVHALVPHTLKEPLAASPVPVVFDHFAGIRTLSSPV